MPTPAKPLRLFLIRHGETAWSLTGQHTGLTDLPLTDHGEAEARRLRPMLAGETFTHVFTSPLQRAARTCELSGVSPAAEVEPDLVEWDNGDFEGETRGQIAADHPDWNLFRDGAPGGESPGQVSDRADRLIDRLKKLQGDVALFSHGHFCRALAVRWVGLPVSAGVHFPMETAAMGILTHDPHHPDAAVISLWNATPTE